jgi:hypothetical protein
MTNDTDPLKSSRGALWSGGVVHAGKQIGLNKHNWPMVWKVHLFTAAAWGISQVFVECLVCPKHSPVFFTQTRFCLFVIYFG